MIDALRGEWYFRRLTMKSHSFLSTSLLSSLIALVAVATSNPAHAGQRRFAYTYETTTSPKGEVELETWVTWKHSRDSGARLDRFDFRHELEIGLTDHLQIGLYLADWRYDGRDEAGHDFRYLHSGAELIWSLSNPTTDFLGSALYLEALVGDRSFELEGKLILQKNLGPVMIAYNMIIEAEWEGSGLRERKGEFAQSLGVSVDINKHLSVGAEFLHEVEMPEWSATEKSVLWFGPNASVRFGRYFATATGLFRASSNEGEPEVQTRLLFGFDF